MGRLVDRFLELRREAEKKTKQQPISATPTMGRVVNLVERYERWGDIRERERRIAADPALRDRVEVLELLAEQSQLRFAGRPSGYPTLDYRERGSDYLESKTGWTAPRRFRGNL